MNIHYPLNPSTGVEDQTQLPWQNGNPGTGTEGSYPPYQAVVLPMLELLSIIAADPSLTPTDADTGQALKAIEYLIAQAIANIQFPEPPTPPAPVTYTAANEGGLVEASDAFGLDFANLVTSGSINDADLLALDRVSNQAGAHYAATASELASYVLSRLSGAGSLGSYVQYKVFTSSQSWQPDPACAAIEVIACIGGGGGGAYSGPVVAGGGGGGFAAGAYAIGLNSPALAIVVGAGGAGGTSGSPVGGTGGTSSVGSLCSATGGGGANSNSPGGGGSANSIDGVQVRLPGSSGGAGNAPGNGLYFPGTGGAPGAWFGPNVTTGVTNNGLSPGMGGTGGNSTGAAGATNNGGSGANGLVIIKQIMGA